MNIVITGRHFNVTDPIKKHANEKISKLDKFLSKIIEVHAILTVEKDRHTAELTAIGKDMKVTAVETTSDMYVSIDMAVMSLEKQLKKLHDKVKEHRGKRVQKIKERALRFTSILTDYLSKRSEPRPASGIVERKSIPEKPMSLDEAVEELKVSKNEFLVFREFENNTVNVIYKRKDGNFGLIKSGR